MSPSSDTETANDGKNYYYTAYSSQRSGIVDNSVWMYDMPIVEIRKQQQLKEWGKHKRINARIVIAHEVCCLI